MVWVQSGGNAAVWAKAPEKMRFVKKMPTATNYEKWLMRVRISSSNGKPRESEKRHLVTQNQKRRVQQSKHYLSRN